MNVLPRPAENIDIQVFYGVHGGAAAGKREALHVTALGSTHCEYSLLSYKTNIPKHQ